MSYPTGVQDPYRFADLTKRAYENRKKRNRIPSNQIYIAFLDPNASEPIPLPSSILPTASNSSYP